MKALKKEIKALKEYMNNYSTPTEIADKYKIDINRLRELIEYELDKEALSNKRDYLFGDQVGNPFIDLD